jgi:8-oxo-dGTP pyrophosphatase MutT (NUDIX family)
MITSASLCLSANHDGRLCRGSELHSRRPPIAAAVVVRDGRVPLVRRRIPEAGFSWGFIGGEVEPETLHRPYGSRPSSEGGSGEVGHLPGQVLAGVVVAEQAARAN